MKKHILTEEIIRINQIIHGKSIINEGFAEQLFNKFIKTTIVTQIDSVVSKILKSSVDDITRNSLIIAIKNNSIEGITTSLKNNKVIIDEIYSKCSQNLEKLGFQNMDENTVRAKIMSQIDDESIVTALKNDNKFKLKLSTVSQTIDNKVKIKPKPKPEPKPKPKPEPKPEPKPKPKPEPKPEMKPNPKPSDLGNITPEMKAEAQKLSEELTANSKKTLFDYFKKGGKATLDGIKKLIRIGILDKYGKLSRRKLIIWGIVLGAGSLYYIGKWSEDNPETEEDDNLIDDSNNTDSTDNDSTDNKPTDNKPTDNKPTDNKPIDNKPIDGKITSGGITYDSEYDLPGYSSVDLDWDKLKM